MTWFIHTIGAVALIVIGGAVAGAAAPRTMPPQELTVAQAVRIPLDSGASALVYWLRGRDGADVVTTIDTPVRDRDGSWDHALVRVEATLLPGESQRVAVPAPIEQQQLGRQEVLRIMRAGDHVEIGVERSGSF